MSSGRTKKEDAKGSKKSQADGKPEQGLSESSSASSKKRGLFGLFVIPDSYRKKTETKAEEGAAKKDEEKEEEDFVCLDECGASDDENGGDDKDNVTKSEENPDKVLGNNPSSSHHDMNIKESENDDFVCLDECGASDDDDENNGDEKNVTDMDDEKKSTAGMNVEKDTNKVRENDTNQSHYVRDFKESENKECGVSDDKKNANVTSMDDDVKSTTVINVEETPNKIHGNDPSHDDMDIKESENDDEGEEEEYISIDECGYEDETEEKETEESADLVGDQDRSSGYQPQAHASYDETENNTKPSSSTHIKMTKGENSELISSREPLYLVVKWEFYLEKLITSSKILLQYLPCAMKVKVAVQDGAVQL